MRDVLIYMYGGLGNQCFVYAMGRSLADKTKARYNFDIGFFPDDFLYKLRYDLSAFNIRIDGSRELPLRILRKLDRRLSRVASRMPVLRSHYCYESQPPRYQPVPTEWSGRLILNGYWQSEKYFEDIKPQLAQDLTLKDVTPFARDSIADLIQSSCNSVFLHIRSYKEVIGKQDGSLSLPVSYFQNALMQMKDLLKSFNLFVFSDDVQWTKSRLHVPADIQVRYIEPSGKGPKFDTLRDFYLMRLCKHGVIANSSFSWWAGWLGEQDWLAKGEKPIRMRANRTEFNNDYWPDRWQVIPIE